MAGVLKLCACMAGNKFYWCQYGDENGNGIWFDQGLTQIQTQKK